MSPLGRNGVTSATIDPGRSGLISFLLDADKDVEVEAKVDVVDLNPEINWNESKLWDGLLMGANPMISKKNKMHQMWIKIGRTGILV